MPRLTDRQLEVLQAIRRLSRRGYPPTLRELASELGIRSTNGINDHLKALANKGAITRVEKQARSIVLAEGYR